MTHTQLTNVEDNYVGKLKNLMISFYGCRQICTDTPIQDGPNDEAQDKALLGT